MEKTMEQMILKLVLMWVLTLLALGVGTAVVGR